MEFLANIGTHTHGCPKEVWYRYDGYSYSSSDQFRDLFRIDRKFWRNWRNALTAYSLSLTKFLRLTYRAVQRLRSGGQFGSMEDILYGRPFAFCLNTLPFSSRKNVKKMSNLLSNPTRTTSSYIAFKKRLYDMVSYNNLREIRISHLWISWLVETWI